MNKHILFATVLLQPLAGMAQYYPHTDPTNTGSWVLVENMSDEFNGTAVDDAKWQVCGKDGVYWGGTPGFTGRGYPSTRYDTGWEYSPDNVRVESGMLKITTKYDPTYAWVNNPNNYNFEFTTGGVWSKNQFTRGYMEIRCKLPVTDSTGAFWTTGNQAELDVFEATGLSGTRKNLLWSTIHDWAIPAPNKVWTDTNSLSFDFSDGFHTYSADWDETSVKIYADGQLIHQTTRGFVENITGDYDSDRWPMTGGQHVWADSEIFPWWGQSTTNMPADFEVDYIRVWQKSSPCRSK